MFCTGAAQAHRKTSHSRTPLEAWYAENIITCYNVVNYIHKLEFIYLCIKSLYIVLAKRTFSVDNDFGCSN